mmetsp:Transcript_58644/g.166718  ORF Transcript_58644/g.166718 Transcript_58644/m.166718 type:complete len:248 (-) Transcript_58644:19-762(-)
MPQSCRAGSNGGHWTADLCQHAGHPKKLAPKCSVHPELNIAVLHVPPQSSAPFSNRKLAANSSFLSHARYAWRAMLRSKPRPASLSTASRSPSVSRTTMGLPPGAPPPSPPGPPAASIASTGSWAWPPPAACMSICMKASGFSWMARISSGLDCCNAGSICASDWGFCATICASCMKRGFVLSSCRAASEAGLPPPPPPPPPAAMAGKGIAPPKPPPAAAGAGSAPGPGPGAVCAGPGAAAGGAAPP